MTHAGSRFNDVVLDPGRAHELKFGLISGASEALEPVLSILTEIERIEEIGAGPPRADVGTSAEVRYRYGLDGWLREEKVAKGNMSRLRKGFELPECGLDVAPLPRLEAREPARQ